MSETNPVERDSLVIWWERSCARKRQELVDPYPLPWDGASHVIFTNHMGLGGFGDERIGNKERLGALMYMVRPFMVEKILSLWPKRKVWSDNEPTP